MPCPKCYWPGVLNSVEDTSHGACVMLGHDSDIGRSVAYIRFIKQAREYAKVAGSLGF